MITPHYITLQATLPSLSSPIVCSGLKNAWMQKESSLCLPWKQTRILQYFGKVQFGSYVSKSIRLLMKLKLIVSSTSTSFWRWALSSPFILYNLVIGFIHGHGHIEAKFGGGIYPHIWSTVGDNIVYPSYSLYSCFLYTCTSCPIQLRSRIKSKEIIRYQ